MNGALRNMTTLYLTREDRILLLYRIGSRIADQTYTGCAGGHFEIDELPMPVSAKHVLLHYRDVGR